MPPHRVENDGCCCSKVVGVRGKWFDAVSQLLWPHCIDSETEGQHLVVADDSTV